jgi:hypothetical protein
MARPEHEIAYQEICALVNKHADKIDALELLAIAANMVGKLLALQDQRTVTPSMALEVVSKNIELGNAQALEQVSASQGRA